MGLYTQQIKSNVIS